MVTKMTGMVTMTVMKGMLMLTVIYIPKCISIHSANTARLAGSI